MCSARRDHHLTRLRPLPAQIRQESRVDLDPVPQISEPQVLVLGVLVVVIVGNTYSGDGHVEQVYDIGNARACTHDGDLDRLITDRATDRGDYSLGGGQIERGLGGDRASFVPEDLDDLGVRDAGRKVWLIAHDEPALLSEIVLEQLAGVLWRLSGDKAEIKGSVGLGRYGVRGGRSLVTRMDGTDVQSGHEITVRQACRADG